MWPLRGLSAEVLSIFISERKFYQKIIDIYAPSVDYDVTAQATKRFFATVQNKLSRRLVVGQALDGDLADCLQRSEGRFT